MSLALGAARRQGRARPEPDRRLPRLQPGPPAGSRRRPRRSRRPSRARPYPRRRAAPLRFRDSRCAFWVAWHSHVLWLRSLACDSCGEGPEPFLQQAGVRTRSCRRVGHDDRSPAGRDWYQEHCHCECKIYARLIASNLPLAPPSVLGDTPAFHNWVASIAPACQASRCRPGSSCDICARSSALSGRVAIHPCRTRRKSARALRSFRGESAIYWRLAAPRRRTRS